MSRESQFGAALLFVIPICLLLTVLASATAIVLGFSRGARLTAILCAVGLCLGSVVLFVASPIEIVLPDWLTIGDQLQVSLALRATTRTCVVVCAMSLSLLAVFTMPEHLWSDGAALEQSEADTDLARLGMMLALAAAVMSILVTNLFAWLLFWGLARLGAGLALWALGARLVIRHLAVLGAAADCLICWALLLLWNDMGTANQWVALEPQRLTVTVLRDSGVLSTITVFLLGIYSSAAVVSGQFPLTMRVFDSDRIPLAGRMLISGILVPSCLLMLLRHACLFPAASSPARELMMVLGAWTALLAAATALLSSGWRRRMSCLATSLLGVVFVGAGLGTSRSVDAASMVLVMLLPLLTGCLLRPARHGPASDKSAERCYPRWACAVAGVLLFSGCAGQQAIIGELIRSPMIRPLPAPMQSRLLAGMLVLQLAVAAGAMMRALCPTAAGTTDSWSTLGRKGAPWPLLALVAAVVFAWGIGSSEAGPGLAGGVMSSQGLEFNLSGFAPVLGGIVAWMLMARQGKTYAHPTGTPLVSRHFHIEHVLGWSARSCGRCIAWFVWLVDEFVLSRIPLGLAQQAIHVVARMRMSLLRSVYQLDMLGMLLGFTVLLAIFVWLLD